MNCWFIKGKVVMHDWSSVLGNYIKYFAVYEFCSRHEMPIDIGKCGFHMFATNVLQFDIICNSDRK